MTIDFSWYECSNLYEIDSNIIYDRFFHGTNAQTSMKLTLTSSRNSFSTEYSMERDLIYLFCQIKNNFISTYYRERERDRERERRIMDLPIKTHIIDLSIISL